MFSTTEHHDSHDDHDHATTEHHDHDSHDDHDHDHDDEYSSSDIGLAITLVFLAGMMIAVGGALSFLIPKKYTKVLPIALAFSAGVLIYLAFIEVFEATYSGFESTGEDEWVVHTYTSLTFFGGVALGAILECIVHKLGGVHDHSQDRLNLEYGASSAGDGIASDDQLPREMKPLDHGAIASKSDNNLDLPAKTGDESDAKDSVRTNDATQPGKWKQEKERTETKMKTRITIVSRANLPEEKIKPKKIRIIIMIRQNQD